MTDKPWTEEDEEAIVTCLHNNTVSTTWKQAKEILSLLHSRGLLKEKNAQAWMPATLEEIETECDKMIAAPLESQDGYYSEVAYHFKQIINRHRDSK